jgi:hypothetical protein
MPTESEGSKKQNAPKKPKANGLEAYNTIAETVGGVPSLRVKDNVIQAIVIAGVTCVSVILGTAFGGASGALIGVLLGLLISTFISGFVLMVLGWIRAAKKMNR